MIRVALRRFQQGEEDVGMGIEDGNIIQTTHAVVVLDVIIRGLLNGARKDNLGQQAHNLPLITADGRSQRRESRLPLPLDVRTALQQEPGNAGMPGPRCQMKGSQIRLGRHRIRVCACCQQSGDAVFVTLGLHLAQGRVIIAVGAGFDPLGHQRVAIFGGRASAESRAVQRTQLRCLTAAIGRNAGCQQEAQRSDLPACGSLMKRREAPRIHRIGGSPRCQQSLHAAFPATGAGSLVKRAPAGAVLCVGISPCCQQQAEDIRASSFSCLMQRRASLSEASVHLRPSLQKAANQGAAVNFNRLVQGRHPPCVEGLNISSGLQQQTKTGHGILIALPEGGAGQVMQRRLSVAIRPVSLDTGLEEKLHRGNRTGCGGIGERRATVSISSAGIRPGPKQQRHAFRIPETSRSHQGCQPASIRRIYRTSGSQQDGNGRGRASRGVERCLACVICLLCRCPSAQKKTQGLRAPAICRRKQRRFTPSIASVNIRPALQQCLNHLRRSLGNRPVQRSIAGRIHGIRVSPRREQDLRDREHGFRSLLPGVCTRVYQQSIRVAKELVQRRITPYIPQVHRGASVHKSPDPILAGRSYSLLKRQQATMVSDVLPSSGLKSSPNDIRRQPGNEQLAENGFALFLLPASHQTILTKQPDGLFRILAPKRILDLIHALLVRCLHIHGGRRFRKLLPLRPKGLGRSRSRQNMQGSTADHKVGTQPRHEGGGKRSHTSRS